MAAWKTYPKTYFAAGLAFVGGATAGVYHFMGPIGVVLLSPLWGALLAVPILDGFSAYARLMRWAAWVDVDGHYYEHRARWMDIVEDGGGERFIRIEHVRQFLLDLPADAVFARIYPGRTLIHGRLSLIYLRDDALLEYLAHASSDDALKMRRWVDRDVRRPGQKRREHEGR